MDIVANFIPPVTATLINIRKLVYFLNFDQQKSEERPKLKWANVLDHFTKYKNIL